MAQSSSSIYCQFLLVLFLVLPHTSSASACYSLTSLLSSLQTPLPLKPFPTSHWAHATLWQTAQLIGLSNSLCDGCVCLSGSSDKPKGVLGSLVQSRCPINIWLLELRGSTPQDTVDCTKNRVCSCANHLLGRDSAVQKQSCQTLLCRSPHRSWQQFCGQCLQQLEEFHPVDAGHPGHLDRASTASQHGEYTPILCIILQPILSEILEIFVTYIYHLFIYHSSIQRLCPTMSPWLTWNFQQSLASAS